MDDLRVELDPVEAPFDALARGDRRAGARCQRGEARRRLEDAVTMTHPALLLLREPGEEPAPVVHQLERRAAELPGLGALDAAAEHPDHRLHAVTDAQHRDAEVEQLGAELRCAVGIHRGRPAGEHQRRRAALADVLGVDRVRQELGEHAALADPAGDQLGVLPAEVEDQHLLAGGLGRAQLDGLVGDRLGACDAPGRGRRRRDRGRVSHRLRLPRPPPRPARWSPCPRTARAGASCPRSGAQARPSPRRAGSRGCPRIRRSPSRS